jgi:hypothetical protein
MKEIDMSTGFKGPIVGAPRSTTDGYKYRTGMGMMSSAEFAVFHDDFLLPFASNTTIGWTAIIDTGGTSITNLTATVGANGVMAMNSDDASEGSAIYGAKAFQLVSGKKFFMECRARCNDVTDNAFQFGLSALTAVTNPEDIWTTVAADVLTMGILDGSALVGMLADEGNAGTAVVAGTKSMVVNTWHTLAIFYDGTRAYGFVDGDVSVSTIVTIPEAVSLAPFVGHLNGNGAGNNTSFVDYVRIVSER